MPRVPIDYSKSIIYKICCNDTSITDCYIGSTTDLYRRKASHKSTCNNTTNKSYNMNVYKFIREYGEWSNWSIVVIEEYNAQNKNDLHSRERYWMEQLKATLNKSIPTRTQQEYGEQYREDHKEEIALKKNEKVNCPCGVQHTIGNTIRHLKSKKHQASILQILPNPPTEPLQEPTDDEEPLGGHSVIF